jgi:hypothetical protein
MSDYSRSAVSNLGLVTHNAPRRRKRIGETAALARAMYAAHVAVWLAWWLRYAHNPAPYISQGAGSSVTVFSGCGA